MVPLDHLPSFTYHQSSVFSAVEEDQRSITPQPTEADIASNSGDSIAGSTRSSPLEKSIDEAFTRAVTPGQETVIKIQKGSSGLGLSIVGGSDSLLVSFHFLAYLHFLFFSCLSTSP